MSTEETETPHGEEQTLLPSSNVRITIREIMKGRPLLNVSASNLATELEAEEAVHVAIHALKLGRNAINEEGANDPDQDEFEERREARLAAQR